MDTKKIAEEIRSSIALTIDAHTYHGKTEDATIRFWDRATPYAVHPIWCGMTLLTETLLPEKTRVIGYKALLWHDILEDTNFPLPENIEPEAKALIDEMTFALGSEEEKRLIWERSDAAKLLKLYDKTSNLLDNVWLNDQRWNDLVAYTLKLTEFAEKTYGNLNIVKISRALCLLRK